MTALGIFLYKTENTLMRLQLKKIMTGEPDEYTHNGYTHVSVTLFLHPSTNRLVVVYYTSLNDNRWHHLT